MSKTAENLKIKEGYPLLGNYDHFHTSIKLHELEHFARWNMLTLNYQTAYYASASLKKIKNLNPNIKILAWISIGLACPTPDAYEHYLETSNEDWWVHKRGMESSCSTRYYPISDKYPDLVMPNPKSKFASHIVKFMQEEIISSELYDGIFYDCVWDFIDQDLKYADISASEYTEGVAGILRDTREKIGSKYIIIGNPGTKWSANCPYWDYANGHYQENALGDVFGSDWKETWKIYQYNMNKKAPPPRINWIGVDTQYKRDRIHYMKVEKKDLTAEDLRRMRLGLGTTLLDNGYFGFDKGDGFHGYGESWWFSEYDVNLGYSKGKYSIEDKLYKRYFENGVVIVNPSDGYENIQLDHNHKDVSTGASGTEFKLPPKDARILLKI
jgi:hypothetical protein